ncbi:Uma2 family endonuclease [Lentzea sp. BCCO 10_0061]|uniref:Uma2 family endonuclease n=1 Tax=Lentzea sokolovensis TaxID=3095429 RepID=A0ABU4UXS9_9PSEU|nr:Uma2 family endonuclease [Lentzea sp. BCCO 10_0061]MDX8143583.1 Uma2 family endonuclease [Lentzea sp. BCCO 10_0061]
MTELLTVAQYAALGEAEAGYTELVEGRLIRSPKALAEHNYACGNLIMQLAGQLPEDLQVTYAVEVDLELAPSDKPGFVRRPDLVVFQRGRRTGGLVRAAEVVLAVEVLSSNSHYTDRRAKRLDYAEAGIPFYWIVDLAEPVSLTPLRLTEERVYQEAPAETGVHEAVEPFPLKIQMDLLID